jgi:hypothetical protein
VLRSLLGREPRSLRQYFHGLATTDDIGVFAADAFDNPGQFIGRQIELVTLSRCGDATQA